MAKNTYIRVRCTEREKEIIEALALRDPRGGNISKYIMGLAMKDFERCHEVEVYGCLYREDKEVRREFLGRYLVDEEGRTSVHVYARMMNKCEELFGEIKYLERRIIKNSEGKICRPTSPLKEYVYLE